MGQGAGLVVKGEGDKAYHGHTTTVRVAIHRESVTLNRSKEWLVWTTDSVDSYSSATLTSSRVSTKSATGAKDRPKVAEPVATVVLTIHRE